MVLAGFPAEACAEGAISDGVYRIRPVELAIESQGADERNRCGIHVGADRYGRGEAERAARDRDVTEWKVTIRGGTCGIELLL
jgi:hypothetical protein